jgi:alpha-mannosidase
MVVGGINLKLWLSLTRSIYMLDPLWQRQDLYEVCDLQVIWQERQTLLKVGFPVDINTSYATYDIPFGNLRRPTHRNTPYDMAKFEVPAHQWVDLAEGGYGVSLLNDCKYGHESNGKLIRLTLLKGSIYPDPGADPGDHHFTYALYPHAGTWETSQTIQHALNLNQGLTWYSIPSSSFHSRENAFLQCNASNVTLEAIKLSEDGRHLVVRLVERENRYTSTSLIFDRSICEAWSCDLMENKETQLTPSDKAIQIVLKPYEILTLRVSFSSMTGNQE